MKDSKVMCKLEMELDSVFDYQEFLRETLAVDVDMMLYLRTQSAQDLILVSKEIVNLVDKSKKTDCCGVN